MLQQRTPKSFTTPRLFTQVSNGGALPRRQFSFLIGCRLFEAGEFLFDDSNV